MRKLKMKIRHYHPDEHIDEAYDGYNENKEDDDDEEQEAQEDNDSLDKGMPDIGDLVRFVLAPDITAIVTGIAVSAVDAMYRVAWMDNEGCRVEDMVHAFEIELVDED
jgi:hypothetical protein